MTAAAGGWRFQRRRRRSSSSSSNGGITVAALAQERRGRVLRAENADLKQRVEAQEKRIWGLTGAVVGLEHDALSGRRLVVGAAGG